MSLVVSIVDGDRLAVATNRAVAIVAANSPNKDCFSVGLHAVNSNIVGRCAEISLIAVEVGSEGDSVGGSAPLAVALSRLGSVEYKLCLALSMRFGRNLSKRYGVVDNLNTRRAVAAVGRNVPSEYVDSSVAQALDGGVRVVAALGILLSIGSYVLDSVVARPVASCASGQRCLHLVLVRAVGDVVGTCGEAEALVDNGQELAVLAVSIVGTYIAYSPSEFCSCTLGYAGECSHLSGDIAGDFFAIGIYELASSGSTCSPPALEIGGISHVVGSGEHHSAVAYRLFVCCASSHKVVVDGDVVRFRARAVGTHNSPCEGDAIGGDASYSGVGILLIRDLNLVFVATLNRPLAFSAGDFLTVESISVATGVGGLAFHEDVGIHGEHRVGNDEVGMSLALALACNLAPYVPPEGVLAGDIEVDSGGAVACSTLDAYIVGTAHGLVRSPLAANIVAHVADSVSYEICSSTASDDFSILLTVDCSVRLVVGYCNLLGVVALAALALGDSPDEVLRLVDCDAFHGSLVFYRARRNSEARCGSPLAVSLGIHDGISFKLDSAVAGDSLIEDAASLDVVVDDDNFVLLGAVGLVTFAVDDPSEGVVVAIEVHVIHRSASGDGGGSHLSTLDERAGSGSPLADDARLEFLGLEGYVTIADFLVEVVHHDLSFTRLNIVDGEGSHVVRTSVGILDSPSDIVVAVGKTLDNHLVALVGYLLECETRASPSAGVCAVRRNLAFNFEFVATDYSVGIDSRDEPVVDDGGLHAVGAGGVAFNLHYVAELGLGIVGDVVNHSIVYTVVLNARYLSIGIEGSAVSIGYLLPITLGARLDIAGGELCLAVASIVSDVGGGGGLYVDEGYVVGSGAAVGRGLGVVEAYGRLAFHVNDDCAIDVLSVGCAYPSHRAAFLDGRGLYGNSLATYLTGLGDVVGSLVGVNSEAVGVYSNHIGRLFAALGRVGNPCSRLHSPVELVVAALEVLSRHLVVASAGRECHLVGVNTANTCPLAFATSGKDGAYEFNLVVAGGTVGVLIRYLSCNFDALVGDNHFLRFVGTGEVFVLVLSMPRECNYSIGGQGNRDGGVLAACSNSLADSGIVGSPPALDTVNACNVLGVEFNHIVANGLARGLDAVGVALIEHAYRIGLVLAGAVVVVDSPYEGGSRIFRQVGDSHLIVGIGTSYVLDGRRSERPLTLASHRSVGDEVDILVTSDCGHRGDGSIVHVVVRNHHSGGLGTAIVICMESECVVSRFGEVLSHCLVDNAAGNCVVLAVALRECHSLDVRFPPYECICGSTCINERKLILAVGLACIACQEVVVGVVDPYGSLRLADIAVAQLVTELEDEVNTCVVIDVGEYNSLASGSLEALVVNRLCRLPVTVALGLPSSGEVVTKCIGSGEFHAIVADGVFAVIELGSLYCDKRYNLVVVELDVGRLLTESIVKRPLESYASIRDVVDVCVPSGDVFDIAVVEARSERSPSAVCRRILRRTTHLCCSAADAAVFTIGKFGISVNIDNHRVLDYNVVVSLADVLTIDSAVNVPVECVVASDGKASNCGLIVGRVELDFALVDAVLGPVGERPISVGVGAVRRYRNSLDGGIVVTDRLLHLGYNRLNLVVGNLHSELFARAELAIGIALEYLPCEVVAAIDGDINHVSLEAIIILNGDATLRSPLAPDIAGIDGSEIVGHEVDSAVAGFLVFKSLASGYVVVDDSNLVVNVVAIVLNPILVSRTVNSPAEYIVVACETVVCNRGVGSDGRINILTLNHSLGGCSGPLAGDILGVVEVLSGEFYLAVAYHTVVSSRRGNLSLARVDIDDSSRNVILGTLLSTIHGRIDGELYLILLASLEASNGSLAIELGLSNLRAGIGRPLAGVALGDACGAYGEFSLVVASVCRSGEYRSSPAVVDGDSGGSLTFVEVVGLYHPVEGYRGAFVDVLVNCVVLGLVVAEVARASVVDTPVGLVAVKCGGCKLLLVVTSLVNKLLNLCLGLTVDDSDVVGLGTSVLGNSPSKVGLGGDASKLAGVAGGFCLIDECHTRSIDLPEAGASHSVRNSAVGGEYRTADPVVLGLLIPVGIHREGVVVDEYRLGVVNTMLAGLSVGSGRLYHPSELVVAAVHIGDGGVVGCGVEYNLIHIGARCEYPVASAIIRILGLEYAIVVRTSNHIIAGIGFYADALDIHAVTALATELAFLTNNPVEGCYSGCNASNFDGGVGLGVAVEESNIIIIPIPVTGNACHFLTREFNRIATDVGKVACRGVDDCLVVLVIYGNRSLERTLFVLDIPIEGGLLVLGQVADSNTCKRGSIGVVSNIATSVPINTCIRPVALSRSCRLKSRECDGRSTDYIVVLACNLRCGYSVVLDNNRLGSHSRAILVCNVPYKLIVNISAEVDGDSLGIVNIGIIIVAKLHGTGCYSPVASCTFDEIFCLELECITISTTGKSIFSRIEVGVLVVGNDNLLYIRTNLCARYCVLQRPAECDGTTLRNIAEVVIDVGVRAVTVKLGVITVDSGPLAREIDVGIVVGGNEVNSAIASRAILLGDGVDMVVADGDGARCRAVAVGVGNSPLQCSVVIGADASDGGALIVDVVVGDCCALDSPSALVVGTDGGCCGSLELVGGLADIEDSTVGLANLCQYSLSLVGDSHLVGCHGAAAVGNHPLELERATLETLYRSPCAVNVLDVLLGVVAIDHILGDVGL